MQVRHGSVHHQILDRLCSMPKAVRGMSATMLQRIFGDIGAVEDLAAAGLLTKRGWADGPGSIWIPTPAGEALNRAMAEAPRRTDPLAGGDRLELPQRSS